MYTQRKDSIDKLDAALVKIRKMEIKRKEVTVFMDKLQLFYTNTELGNDYLALLFYPPTAALKSGCTLGNATGRELVKENIDASVIECFPFAHVVKSNKFDQRKFLTLFENNEKFQKVIKRYIMENFRIEHEAFRIRHRGNHSRHPVYIGGVVASLVYKQCYHTHEKEADAHVSVHLLTTQCFENGDDMYYAMEGVHPSYHLMRGRAKEACECFRLNMVIFRALTNNAIENIPMKDTLTLEQAAKIQECNDVVNLLIFKDFKY